MQPDGAQRHLMHAEWLNGKQSFNATMKKCQENTTKQTRCINTDWNRSRPPQFAFSSRQRVLASRLSSRIAILLCLRCIRHAENGGARPNWCQFTRRHEGECPILCRRHLKIYIFIADVLQCIRRGRLQIRNSSLSNVFYALSVWSNPIQVGRKRCGKQKEHAFERQCDRKASGYVWSGRPCGRNLMIKRG